MKRRLRRLAVLLGRTFDAEDRMLLAQAAVLGSGLTIIVLWAVAVLGVAVRLFLGLSGL